MLLPLVSSCLGRVDGGRKAQETLTRPPHKTGTFKFQRFVQAVRPHERARRCSDGTRSAVISVHRHTSESTAGRPAAPGSDAPARRAFARRLPDGAHAAVGVIHAPTRPMARRPRGERKHALDTVARRRCRAQVASKTQPGQQQQQQQQQQQRSHRWRPTTGRRASSRHLS